jgi:SAM-dependent methyltransferase
MSRNAAIRKVMQWAGAAGINVHYLAGFRRLPRYRAELARYREQARGTRFSLEAGRRAPILTDYDAEAGIARGHYFHQDLWAARRVFAARPKRHVDIGSRVDGFGAHVLSFMPLTIVDIRPLESAIEGLTFIQGDATNLSSIPDGSVESLSSLHAVEHIGLGRYGDTVDADGWRKALGEMRRVLAPGGRLYLSVPIGRERVEFNSHRVFNPRTIVDAMAPLELAAFHAVDDGDQMRTNADLDAFGTANFSCGMFEFVKAGEASGRRPPI